MPPLTGITVVDFSTAMPGPFCTTLLADMGARVIKVERPGGEDLRAFPAMFDSVNRSKESIVLNLKSPEGQDIAIRLARVADIVIEQFRPGVADRLGIGQKQLREVNPSLIYCSITAFGQDGPYRDRPGHDLNCAAMGGLIALAAAMGGPVTPPPVLLADLASGLYAAVAVLAALAERQKTGKGTYIDLSMTESIVSLLGSEINSAFVSGRTAERPNVTSLPHYGVFPTSDGRYLSIGVVYEQHFWAELCSVTGLDGLISLDLASRADRFEEIQQRLASVVRQKTLVEWEELLCSRGVPACGVADLLELGENPQFVYRQVLRTLQSKGRESIHALPPFRSPDGFLTDPTPPPEAGENSASILQELGFSLEEITSLYSKKITE